MCCSLVMKNALIVFTCDVFYLFIFCLLKRPPLRQYLLDGEFFVGAAIACTLTKLALRYLDIEEDKEKQNVSLHEKFFFYQFQGLFDPS